MHKGRKPLVALAAILVIALASCATKKPVVEEAPPVVTTTTVAPAPVPEAAPATTTTTIAHVVTVAEPSVSEVELRNLFGQANSLRNEAVENDLARVVPDDFNAADKEFADAKAAYDSAMDAVPYDGVKSFPVKEQLEKSIASWESVIEKGKQALAKEESDKAAAMKELALKAQEQALSLKADLNAPDKYAPAEDSLKKGVAEQEAGNYKDAANSFGEAEKGFNAAYEDAKALQASNAEAVAAAEKAVKASEEKAAGAGVEGNEYLPKAKSALETAKAQSADMRFADSTASAEEAIKYAKLSDDYVDAELAKKAEAKAAEEKAQQEAEAKAAQEAEAKAAAEKAQQEAEAKAAEEKAKQEAEAKAAADAKAAAQAAAKADIDKAQEKYDWANSVNAKNNYPELLEKGAADLESAKTAFAAEDYKGASEKALAALDTLSGIEEFAPLPAVYIVRLIPERRDCLWRIAEYPFIYNNPLKWPVLYEENKKTFRDPSNPDLIYPDQVLNIPSIKDEKREGTWDPNKTYNPLPKK